VSHEFKTPLMALNSKNDLILTMLEKDKFSPESLNEFIEFNKYYIKKLDKILEVLMLITRLKDKNIKLNLGKVDLKIHIEKVIKDKNVENIKII
jgi:K+-sensing histidine kinase KdpD